MEISPANITKTKHKSKDGFLKEVRKNKVLFIMMLPALVVLLINNYIPMAGVLIAFKNFTYQGGNIFANFFQSKWVGLKNFEFFTSTPDAWEITRNTVGYNLVFIILGLLVAVTFAIALNEVKNKFMSRFYQATMILPYFMSWIVVSYLVFALISEEQGFINKSLLPALGWTENLPAWYADTKYWPPILILVNMWKYTGYNCVVYIAAISGIDTEYYEAATVDGASKFQQIKKITIPLLTPLMIIMTLLAVGRIFNSDFGLFFSVPRNVGMLWPVTNTIDTYVYNALTNLNDIGMSSAVGFYQAIVGFATVMVSNFVVRKIDPEKALF